MTGRKTERAWWPRDLVNCGWIQVFVMTGWYPCVKKALIERGWAQNPDRDSPFFDLKWTLHSQDIRTTDIEPWQLCNHFFKVLFGFGPNSGTKQLCMVFMQSKFVVERRNMRTTALAFNTPLLYCYFCWKKLEAQISRPVVYRRCFQYWDSRSGTKQVPVFFRG